MLAEKIAMLDTILRAKHTEVYVTLQPSDTASSLLEAPLRDWYQWRNGQHREEENLFLEMHRFFSIEDAQQLLEITQRLSIRAEHH
jgi:hypothetical protein